MLRVAGLFIAYLESYAQFRDHGQPSIGTVYALILQQTLLAYALMSATIPCLKGFLGRFRTGDLATLSESATGYGQSYGQSYGQNSNRSGRHGSGGHGQSFALKSLDRTGVNLGTGKRTNDGPSNLRPDDIQNSTLVYSDAVEGDNGSATSFGSEQMIIHRKVEWNVVPE